ncbi:hypothetical protein LTR66_001639, partial [Elasticomyces elasticus]
MSRPGPTSLAGSVGAAPALRRPQPASIWHLAAADGATGRSGGVETGKGDAGEYMRANIR